jgi:hypothetical protein
MTCQYCLVSRRLHVLPVHIAIILAPRSKFFAELYSREGTLLAVHRAYKLDGSVHAPGNVNQVTDLKVVIGPA